MNKTNTTVLYTLVAMLTIWCTYNTANTGGFLSKVDEYRVEVHTFQRQVASLIDIANSQEQRDEDVIVKEEVKEVETPTEDVLHESVE